MQVELFVPNKKDSRVDWEPFLAESPTGTALENTARTTTSSPEETLPIPYSTCDKAR